jgi:hypothetical protein
MLGREESEAGTVCESPPKRPDDVELLSPKRPDDVELLLSKGMVGGGGMRPMSGSLGPGPEPGPGEAGRGVARSSGGGTFGDEVGDDPVPVLDEWSVVPDCGISASESLESESLDSLESVDSLESLCSSRCCSFCCAFRALFFCRRSFFFCFFLAFLAFLFSFLSFLFDICETVGVFASGSVPPCGAVCSRASCPVILKFPSH